LPTHRNQPTNLSHITDVEESSSDIRIARWRVGNRHLRLGSASCIGFKTKEKQGSNVPLRGGGLA